MTNYHTREELSERIHQFDVGDHVSVSTESWLHAAGAASGTVAKLGRSKIHIEADVNGVVYGLSPFMVEQSA